MWGELSWGEFSLGRVVLGRVVFGASCPDPGKKNRGALHKRGASERFAALFYATVCFKKAPRSAPRHSLELSIGERFFATYRCIEI